MLILNQPVVTRSHKFTDRVYGDAALEQEAHGNNLPKFFGKNTGFDTDPKKTKKDGGGKGNWFVSPHSTLVMLLVESRCSSANTHSIGAIQAKKPKTSPACA
jgi:hypothetical protein